MSFRNAIVRKPGRSIADGISSSNLGRPDYQKACMQHSAYIDALRYCGLDVMVLEEKEDYPDSTFIEDNALLTEECAIICRPGAKTRLGETEGLDGVLKNFYNKIYRIDSPGTLEAGDVMMVGRHFYIGLSERTNSLGAKQLISILENHGFSGSTIKLDKVLHLKTGVSYLENNKLLACGEFITRPELSTFDIIEVKASEAYSANCIWVNDKVLIPKDYPITKSKIEKAGYPVVELEMSEFRKVDGGLSCLSLRF